MSTMRNLLRNGDLPSILQRLSDPEEMSELVMSSQSSSPNPTGTHVFFYDAVEPATVATLVKDLRVTANTILKAFVDWEVPAPPINLHINSDGGDFMSGIAGGETIRRLKLPVHTHIEGGAASASTILSVSGSHRTITKNSFILIHQIKAGFWGKTDELEEHHANIDKFMAFLCDFYTEKAKVPKGKIKELLKHDLWFNADEALKYGLETVFPTHLHIHSYGGELLAGLSGADSILSQNVHTHIEGGAASSVCGKHRTITPHSFMLIHQLSTGFWGKYMDIEDFKGSMDRFMDSVINIYDKQAKFPKVKLKEVLRHDLWFSAEEALKFGLVDEIK